MLKFSWKLSPRLRVWLAIIVGVLILGAVNFSIYQREQLLQHGRFVLLELAPVDPRSLMQGDYMALRFQVANQAFPNFQWGSRRTNGDMNAIASDGAIVVHVDEHQVGHFQRIAKLGEPLAANEVLMRYRIRNSQIKFATNAFFFEEGQAHLYDKARYGGFRVAGNGDMLLSSMHAADYTLLQKQAAQ
ncbi:GDYXXLXY domain-containing protein [Undibacterium sp.]|uniref:GDYXXLXY domain-containing protein n=1 Tax=Undibacterium sp. TaxID=1914977 RepID=UPI003752F2F6